MIDSSETDVYKEFDLGSDSKNYNMIKKKSEKKQNKLCQNNEIESFMQNNHFLQTKNKTEYKFNSL